MLIILSEIYSFCAASEDCVCTDNGNWRMQHCTSGYYSVCETQISGKLVKGRLGCLLMRLTV